MTFGYLANELFLYIILKPVTSTRHLRKSDFQTLPFNQLCREFISDTVVSED